MDIVIGVFLAVLVVILVWALWPTKGRKTDKKCVNTALLPHKTGTSAYKPSMPPKCNVGNKTTASMKHKTSIPPKPEASVKSTCVETGKVEIHLEKPSPKTDANNEIGNFKISLERTAREDTPSPEEAKCIQEENDFRKKATALKKERKYDEAVESMRKARDAQYKTSEYWTMQTLFRIPKYLMLAKRYSEAYDEAILISQFKWPVAGMIANTMESTKVVLKYCAMEIAYDAASLTEDETLIQNAAGILNEMEGRAPDTPRNDDDGQESVIIKALGEARVEEIKREYREKSEYLGYDIGQISKEGCECLSKMLLKKWSGTYISVLGKVPELPTIDDALADGMFCALDCCHRVDYIDFFFDKGVPQRIKQLVKGMS